MTGPLYAGYNRDTPETCIDEANIYFSRETVVAAREKIVIVRRRIGGFAVKRAH